MSPEVENALITAAAVLVVALLGGVVYRYQKNLDRKQEAYSGYLAAFQQANFWNNRKNDPQETAELRLEHHELHHEAHARYQEVFERLLLVAPKHVVDGATAFHRCYVQENVQEREDELKTRYAKMVFEMREDGFAKGLTEQEIKDRIPWEV